MSSKFSTHGNGRASYVSPTDQPTPAAIALVPGAQEAYDAWQQANADGAPLRAAARAAGQALVGLRVGPQKRPDVPLAEYEAAEAAVRDADAALRAQDRVALAALRKFDQLMTAGPADDQRSRAAEVALAKHAEAVAAAEVLFAAIRERDRAASRAGLPRARSWLAYSPAYIDGGLGQAEQTIQTAINRFAVAEVETLAEGDEPTPAPPVEKPDGKDATFRAGDVLAGGPEW